MLMKDENKLLGVLALVLLAADSIDSICFTILILSNFTTFHHGSHVRISLNSNV